MLAIVADFVLVKEPNPIDSFLLSTLRLHERQTIKKARNETATGL